MRRSVDQYFSLAGHVDSPSGEKIAPAGVPNAPTEYPFPAAYPTLRIKTKSTEPSIFRATLAYIVDRSYVFVPANSAQQNIISGAQLSAFLISDVFSATAISNIRSAAPYFLLLSTDSTVNLRYVLKIFPGAYLRIGEYAAEHPVRLYRNLMSRFTLSRMVLRCRGVRRMFLL